MNDEIEAPSFHGSGARREGRATNETLASPFLWADDGVDAPPPPASVYPAAGDPAQSTSLMVGDLLARRSPSRTRRDRPTGSTIKTERYR
jgi:hypothetical protein